MLMLVIVIESEADPPSDGFAAAKGRKSMGHG